MATLPKEQVTQRTKTADVSVTYDTLGNAPGEKLWLSTTTLPYTVVNTKSVAGNQALRDDIDARLQTAHDAQAGDDLYADQGIGFPAT